MDGFWQIIFLTQTTFKISSGISKLSSKSWFWKQSFIVTQPYSFIYSGRTENLRQSAKPRIFAFYKKSLLTPDVEHYYYPRKFPHDPSLSILTPHVIVILILFTLNSFCLFWNHTAHSLQSCFHSESSFGDWARLLFISVGHPFFIAE